jgi:hypothetical protein
MFKVLLRDMKRVAIRMWRDEKGNLVKMFTPPGKSGAPPVRGTSPARTGALSEAEAQDAARKRLFRQGVMFT